MYVLTSNATFSSANWFATVLRDNGVATIVGEPTGNAPSSFGETLSFTLPASRYSFTLSCKKYVRPDPARDPQVHLVPDRLVPRTRRDIIQGTDPVLEDVRRRAWRDGRTRK